MNKVFTKEQVLEAHKKVPDAVREVLGSEKTADFAFAIREKYALHIDVAGVFSKSLGYLLLGLISPQEFLEELIAAKIPDKDARTIMTEINQKIFVPLREQVMSGGGNASQQNVPQPAKLLVPRPPVPAPQKFMHLENKIPPRPAQSLRPPVSVATPVPPRFVVSPRVPLQGSSAPQNGLAAIHHQPLVTPATPPPSPKAMEWQGSQTSLLAKPIANEKLLEDHEEPHVEFNKAPGSLLETPLRQALRTVIPPANLPGTFQSRPTPVEVRPSPRPDVAFGEVGSIIPKFEPSSSPKPSVPAAPTKPYSGDPYREPIEP